MVLTFLLFTFLATSRGVPLTSNSPHMTEAKIEDPSVYILGRDIPECLKLNHYRTTSQIVWSCLATIFACTWVAVHPNLPGPHDSGFQRFRRRITITMVAIIAPELIAIFASVQLDAAKVIKRKFNVKFNGGDDPELSLLEAVISWFTSPFHAIKQWFMGPPDKVNRKWTLTHGFFIQMGGFMMYHDGKPVQVLTFNRLLKAIERGEIDVPYIPEEDILDKSKGDGLSKLVVVLQTTWFVAQCVGRWISHLPMSELEVSTLAFAVLNAYIYAIWWSKPQGVLVPIKLEFKARPLPSNDCPSTSQPSLSPPAPCSSGSSSSKEPLLVPATNLSDAGSSSLLVCHNGDQREHSIRPVVEVEFDKGSLHWIRTYTRPPPYSQNHLKRVLEFSLYLLRIFGIVLIYPFTLVAKIPSPVQVGKSRVSIFYADGDHLSKLSVLRGFSLLAIPPVFGGIHLTLWSAPFQTSLERLLWRISAVYVTTAPLLISTMTMPVSLLKRLGLEIVVDIVPLPLSFTVFLYPVARGILIFISLYTLPHLPEGADYEIHWSALLPHI